MAGIPSLTASISPTVVITAQGTAPSQGLNAPSGGGQYTLRLAKVGTAAANNAAGGADEAFDYLVSLARAATANIDLTGLTNVLGTTGVALVRLKAIMIELLAAADDPTNAPAPNASSITVGSTGANDWVSQSHAGGPLLGATAWSWDIPKGGRLYFDVGPDSAAGSAVDATHKLIKLTNNDATNTAVVRVTIFGGQS